MISIPFTGQQNRVEFRLINSGKISFEERIMIPDEVKLVNRAREGDIAAFEKLYKINREKIFKMAFGFVRNHADAEDLLQETFTRAFIAIRRVRSRQQLYFSTWIYRIGINCCISFLRKSKAQQQGDKQHIFSHKNTLCTDTPGSNPERYVEIEEMKNIFKNVLDSLSSRQRAILVLRYYAGFKIKDIAVRMNCSEGSIKKQLSRGFSKIKKRLNVFFPQEEKDELQKM